MAGNVLTLEYASTQSLGRPQLYAAARSMLWLSVMSGLCVGVCFLWFAESWLAHGLHIAIFSFTIWLAIVSGLRLVRGTRDVDEPARRVRVAMDCIAGAALIIVALAPFGLLLKIESATGSLVLGIAYALLAATTARHVMLYRFLASFCTQVGRTGMAKSFLALGWFKAVYECIWLGSCALALLLSAAREILNMGGTSDGTVVFAFAGLVGCLGFGGVWIWMIVCHARFVQLAK